MRNKCAAKKLVLYASGKLFGFQLQFFFILSHQEKTMMISSFFDKDRSKQGLQLVKSAFLKLTSLKMTFERPLFSAVFWKCTRTK